MTNIERARLLIRVANQIGDGGDKRALLAWADEILAGAGRNTGEDRPIISFPITIFRNYKGTLYQGLLLQDWRVELDGKIYPSPSAAAASISGNQENGLRVWRYRDERSGGALPIGNLKRR